MCMCSYITENFRSSDIVRDSASQQLEITSHHFFVCTFQLACTEESVCRISHLLLSSFLVLFSPRSIFVSVCNLLRAVLKMPCKTSVGIGGCRRMCSKARGPSSKAFTRRFTFANSFSIFLSIPVSVCPRLRAQTPSVLVIPLSVTAGGQICVLNRLRSLTLALTEREREREREREYWHGILFEEPNQSIGSRPSVLIGDWHGI